VNHTHAPKDVGRRALWAAGATALVALVTLFVVFEGRILLLLFAGVLFALALHGTSKPIARVTKIPYGAVLATVTTLMVAALAAGVYFLGAGLIKQAQTFASQAPGAIRSAMAGIRQQPLLAHFLGPLGDFGSTPAAGQEGAAHAAEVASATFEMIGSMIVVFFIGVYGAAQPETYPRVALTLVPAAQRARGRALLSEIGADLTRWLGGRAVAMAIVGALVTVGLLVLKVPLAWALGVFAGLLTFVEYLGAFVSAAPAMLVAFARGPMFVVWVGVVFTAVHILEGYVLTPFLVRTTVKFAPAYTLAAQVVLGAIFGVVGLTFATPAMIVLTIVVRRLYVEAPRHQAPTTALDPARSSAR
jgi:predicted PurR-regulated permease PerM